MTATAATLVCYAVCAPDQSVFNSPRIYEGEGEGEARKVAEECSRKHHPAKFTVLRVTVDLVTVYAAELVSKETRP